MRQGGPAVERVATAVLALTQAAPAAIQWNPRCTEDLGNALQHSVVAPKREPHGCAGAAKQPILLAPSLRCRAVAVEQLLRGLEATPEAFRAVALDREPKLDDFVPGNLLQGEPEVFRPLPEPPALPLKLCLVFTLKDRKLLLPGYSGKQRRNHALQPAQLLLVFL
eukprot:CAMPEP_0177618292 /NCGR_PEP_ID=MMETSP0419_2-20121207/25480_1 /TAXON_ID=582737 /ORGANISM="Tetraselmis sp., Strain GSL018" /LENGTH=165 /DNA_ID=CAMNT_0019117145 /DNA_START=1010 /DNA_END=1508 /DNA_ORIENTATION=-